MLQRELDEPDLPNPFGNLFTFSFEPHIHQDSTHKPPVRNDKNLYLFCFPLDCQCLPPLYFQRTNSFYPRFQAPIFWFTPEYAIPRWVPSCPPHTQKSRWHLSVWWPPSSLSRLLLSELRLRSAEATGQSRQQGGVLVQIVLWAEPDVGQRGDAVLCPTGCKSLHYYLMLIQQFPTVCVCVCVKKMWCFVSLIHPSIHPSCCSYLFVFHRLFHYFFNLIF